MFEGRYFIYRAIGMCTGRKLQVWNQEGMYGKLFPMLDPVVRRFLLEERTDLGLLNE